MNTPATDNVAADPEPSLEAHGDYSLSMAQMRLVEQLTLLIDDAERSLAREDQETRDDDAGTGQAQAVTDLVPGGLPLLISAARRREARAKERRRLAEDMVFSALRNLDNPAWVGEDVAEHGDGAFLRALLQWNSQQ